MYENIKNSVLASKVSWPFWSLLALSMLGCCFFASDVIFNIFVSWGSDEYSYAYFVPFLSLFMALHLLSEKPGIPKPSWLGLLILFATLFLFFMSIKAAIPTLPQYFFLAMVYAVILSFFGLGIVVKIAPALVYLFFAIPLPTSIYYGLSARMQLISSDLGVWILNLIGISVFQDGNIIDLGVYQLEVEEACNGLRYLFPLVSFGFLFFVLMKGPLWQRLFIFFSSVPIALVLNALRIATIGVIAVQSGQKETVDMIHDIQGWVMFFLCVVILFIEVLIFQKFSKKLSFQDKFFELPKGPFLDKPLRVSIVSYCAVLICSAFAIIDVTNMAQPVQEYSPQRTSFLSFPHMIGEWVGKTDPLDYQTMSLLNATDILSVNFSRVGNDLATVGLYVAYYDSQREGRTFHSPSICLPGSGWGTISEATTSIDLPALNTNLNANRLIIQKGLSKLLVYYWYEQRGRSETSYKTVKASILIDSIRTGRTDGALVRVVSPILPNESEREADARLVDFIQSSSSVLSQSIPDYSVVQ